MCHCCHTVTACVTVVTQSLYVSAVSAASIGVFSVCFCPSGAHLAVGCERGLVKVYSTADYKALFELQEQKVRGCHCGGGVQENGFLIMLTPCCVLEY